MTGETAPATERLPRAALAAHQGERLARLLRDIHGRNRFYTRKLEAAGVDPAALVLPRDLAALPFTTKAELVADQAQAPPWGTVLTEPIERYTRYNQTSSTTGKPLRWIDTPESWQWMLDCWKAVYRGAGVDGRDRIFFPFSFGPFLGFWTAFDAATQIGAHAIPAGGMTSEQRLALIETLAPTVVCCTPTYALRLLDVAREAPDRDPPAAGSVRTIIVAGEPGGSIPATRRRIERGWGARVIDHHGLTEVGPISFECLAEPGFVHVNESEFIAEVVDPATGDPVPDGRQGELVVTNLGRTASPLIRYRTRDLVVRTAAPCACSRSVRAAPRAWPTAWCAGCATTRRCGATARFRCRSWNAVWQRSRWTQAGSTSSIVRYCTPSSPSTTAVRWDPKPWPLPSARQWIPWKTYTSHT